MFSTQIPVVRQAKGVWSSRWESDLSKQGFFYIEGSYEGILKSGIEVKVSSEGCLAKCAAVARAKIHIFDNDTSGEIRSIWMTVRYRCGQSNDLPPVWIFLLSVDER